MARKAPRSEVVILAIFGTVIEVGDSQGKSVHMFFVAAVFQNLKTFVVPIDLPCIKQPLAKVNPRNIRLSAWTLAILANPLSFVFNAGSDRIPITGVKASIHWHGFNP
jgi:hypothetical protein